MCHGVMDWNVGCGGFIEKLFCMLKCHLVLFSACGVLWQNAAWSTGM